MRKTVCFILFITLLSLTASGQRFGGPMRAIFQEQPPPPGAVTVLGRSFVRSFQNGFGNSLALLIGSDDNNVQQELGLTDTEVNSIQLIKAQMLLNAPKYATRFKTMTEADQKSIQADLERDMERIAESFNNLLSPDRKEKAQKLVFQSLGGLESPMTSLSSMEVLNLSEDQKKKMQTVFDEMQKERHAQMEASFQLIEQAVALGGPNMSSEDREQLRREGEKLRTQIFSTGKKLAGRLRQHLTTEQLEQEKQLLASRPAFLPRLPKQMRENTENGYRPGVDSWRPGQDVPVQIIEPTYRGFPRTEAK